MPESNRSVRYPWVWTISGRLISRRRRTSRRSCKYPRRGTRMGDTGTPSSLRVRRTECSSGFESTTAATLTSAPLRWSPRASPRRTLSAPPSPIGPGAAMWTTFRESRPVDGFGLVVAQWSVWSVWSVRPRSIPNASPYARFRPQSRADRGQRPGRLVVSALAHGLRSTATRGLQDACSPAQCCVAATALSAEAVAGVETRPWSAEHRRSGRRDSRSAWHCSCHTTARRESERCPE